MSEDTKLLKWHKFMIFFALWAGALQNLIEAFTFLSGSHYGEMKYAVYMSWPIMQWIDIAVGLAYIALVLFIIYTRFQLAGFKKNAPQKLLLLYGANLTITFGYILLVYVATGIFILEANADSAEVIGRVIGTIVFLCVNKIYYDKRAELFVN